jgi:hypothetical protein
MIPEEQDPKVHHMTAKAARTALAHCLISQDSYRSVLRGELSLVDAKALERDSGPSTSAPENVQEKLPEPSPCLCGCGRRPRSPRSRFIQGHDAILRSELVAQIKKGDVLLKSERITPEQRRYAVERGLAGPEVLPEEERNG